MRRATSFGQKRFSLPFESSPLPLRQTERQERRIKTASEGDATTSPKKAKSPCHLTIFMPPLLNGPRGRPMSVSGNKDACRAALASAVRRAGVEGVVSVYDFRHSRISQLANSGASLAGVAFLVGHKAHFLQRRFTSMRARRQGLRLWLRSARWGSVLLKWRVGLAHCTDSARLMDMNTAQIKGLRMTHNDHEAKRGDFVVVESVPRTAVLVYSTLRCGVVASATRGGVAKTVQVNGEGKPITIADVSAARLNVHVVSAARLNVSEAVKACAARNFANVDEVRAAVRGFLK
jgi:hypothetical protein